MEKTPLRKRVKTKGEGDSLEVKDDKPSGINYYAVGIMLLFGLPMLLTGILFVSKLHLKFFQLF
jgi:hypothetical protein